METNSLDKGILGGESSGNRDEIVELLIKAYWMEIETVMSYLAASVNLDGVRAMEIKESLAAEVEDELGHARQFADRIKELYGIVPGSEEFRPEQSFLQPPEHQTDVVHVIRGVIKAETGAIEHYTRVVEETDGVDPVTQDMVIAILRDEQGHRRLFEGFLREYEFEGIA
jgi:bacterioferritin